MGLFGGAFWWGFLVWLCQFDNGFAVGLLGGAFLRGFLMGLFGGALFL